MYPADRQAVDMTHTIAWDRTELQHQFNPLQPGAFFSFVKIKNSKIIHHLSQRSHC